jgi:hypothetical protein
MKPEQEQLDRLMKAAARAPRSETGAALFTLEARVLGNWRLSLRGDSSEVLLTWLRRAAICACLLALGSLAWDYHELRTPRGDELAAADSAMRMGIEP